MKPIYSIRDWDKDFETAESRKIIRTRWVPIPNKQDGKTFSRIARHPRAVDIFCAWQLIIEIASKMPKRGLLVDADGPLDADDFADKTHFPVEIFEIALEVLVQPRFGWLEISTNSIPTVAPPEHPGDEEAPPGGIGASPGDASGGSGDATGAPAAASGPPADAGTEGKGRERQDRVQAAPDDPDLPFHGADFIKEWTDFKKHRSQLRKKLTPIALSRLFKQFEAWGEDQTVAAIRWSLSNGWTGVFLPRLPGAGVQAPMFRNSTEPPEAKQLRENCPRCRGTNTEVVPGKGARPCDHLAVDEIE